MSCGIKERSRESLWNDKVIIQINRLSDFECSSINPLWRFSRNERSLNGQDVWS